MASKRPSRSSLPPRGPSRARWAALAASCAGSTRGLCSPKRSTIPIPGSAPAPCVPIGRRDLIHACVQRLPDEDPTARFSAAAPALLLGDRDRSLGVLEGLSARPHPCGKHALALWLKAVHAPSDHRILKSIAQEPDDRHLPTRGAGTADDAQPIPWPHRAACGPDSGPPLISNRRTP